VLSDGVKSRDEDAPDRWDEYTSACQAVGAKPLRLVRFRDQRAYKVDRLKLAKAVTKLVADLSPTLVYTHFTGDLNVDHRRVAEAVLVATRGVCPVRCVSPEWPDRSLLPWWPRMRQMRLTVAAQERRCKAAACYQSELREWPHPRSLERLRRESIEGYLEIPQWS